MQYVDKAGTYLPSTKAPADLGLHCQLTESKDTAVYVHEQSAQIRLRMRLLIRTFTVCICHKTDCDCVGV